MDGCSRVIKVCCCCCFHLCVRNEHAKEASSSVPSLCGAEDNKRDFYGVVKRSSAATVSQKNARDAYIEKVRRYGI